MFRPIRIGGFPKRFGLSESIGIDSPVGATRCRNLCPVTCSERVIESGPKRERRDVRRPKRFEISASAAVKGCSVGAIMARWAGRTNLTAFRH
jgi:hypothetical protein